MKPPTRSPSPSTRRSLNAPSCSRICSRVRFVSSLCRPRAGQAGIHSPSVAALADLLTAFHSSSSSCLLSLSDVGDSPDQAIPLPNVTANVLKKVRLSSLPYSLPRLLHWSCPPAASTAPARPHAFSLLVGEGPCLSTLQTLPPRRRLIFSLSPVLPVAQRKAKLEADPVPPTPL